MVEKDSKSADISVNINWKKIRCSESFYTILLSKDWEKCGKTNIAHFELLKTTLVGKDGKKCEITKIGYSESFWTTLVGKDWKRCRMTKIGCSK